MNFNYNITSNFQMFFHQAGSCQMEGITALYNYIMSFLVGILCVVTTALVLIIVIHLHGQRHIKQYKSEKDLYLLVNWLHFVQRWTHSTILELIWTIIPTLILIAIAIPSFILLYSLDEIVDTQTIVKITAFQWYWKYEYPVIDIQTNDIFNFSYLSYMLPLEDLTEEESLRLLEVDMPIIVPTNVNIKLIITAKDVIHSFAIPALGVKMDAVPGRLNQVTLHIFKPGIYYGQCSELCGVNHAFMPIALHAIDFNTFNNFLTDAIEIITGKYSRTYPYSSHYKAIEDVLLYRRYLIAFEHLDKDQLFNFMLNVAAEREEILNRAVLYYNNNSRIVDEEVAIFNKTGVGEQHTIDRLFYTHHLLMLLCSVLQLEKIIMVKIDHKLLYQVLDVMFNENVTGDIVFQGTSEKCIPGFESKDMCTTRNKYTLKEVVASFSPFLTEEQVKVISSNCESDKFIKELLDQTVDYSLTFEEKQEILNRNLKIEKVKHYVLNNYNNYQNAIKHIDTITLDAIKNNWKFVNSPEDVDVVILKTIASIKEEIISLHAEKPVCEECITKPFETKITPDTPESDSGAAPDSPASSPASSTAEISVNADTATIPVAVEEPKVEEPKVQVLKPKIPTLDLLNSRDDSGFNDYELSILRKLYLDPTNPLSRDAMYREKCERIYQELAVFSDIRKKN